MENRMNNIELKLGTAYEPVEPLKTRKGTAYRGDIAVDNGRVTAILKLLKLEDIAREVVCWTLARHLELPTPQAFLVQVDPSAVTGRHTGNSDHLAFGSEELRRLFENKSDIKRQVIREWPLAISCAVFDVWIHCTDRFPNNLLVEVNRKIWLIDHEESLPNYANFDTESISVLFHMITENRGESELKFLKRKAVAFAEKCKSIHLDDLEKEVSQKVAQADIRNRVQKHMEFLESRVEILPSLIEKVLGPKKQFSTPKRAYDYQGEGRK